MVKIKGPRFRAARINPNRKLSFNWKRMLPYGKKGVKFRKIGVKFRSKGVIFRTSGISNIILSGKEDPNKLNNTGVKYYNKGDYRTALQYFDKAIKVAPQFDIAMKNRKYCIQMLRLKRESELTHSYVYSDS